MAKDIVTKAEILGGEIDVRANFGQTVKVTVSPDPYMGDTEVTPSVETQVLATKKKFVQDDITVLPAPTEALLTTENGQFTPSDGKVGFSAVTVDVNPDLRPLSVSENGQYSPDGFDGYSDVTVDVEPNLEALSVTENGLYLPESGVDGFDRVSVNVVPDLTTKTITEDGIYSASADGVDGYSQVTVDTGIQWDGTLYPITDETDPLYSDKVFNCKHINVVAGDRVLFDGVGRGRWWGWYRGVKGGAYTSNNMVYNALTEGFTYARFELPVTIDTTLVLAGHEYFADGRHDSVVGNCFFGEYLHWKIIHAT